MTTPYIATQGCALYVQDNYTTPGTPAVVKLASVKGLTSIGGSSSDIDISNLDSVVKEFAKGLKDGGSPSFDLIFNPSDTGHVLLQTLSEAGTNATQNFYFGFSDGTGAGAPTNGPASPVQSNTSTSSTGGTLAASTYYYVVTAITPSGESVASNEKSQATTGSSSTVTLTWSAVAGATGYRIYRGTTAGGESVYLTVGAVTTTTDTGSAGTAGTPPATATAFVPPTTRSGLSFQAYVKQFQIDAAIDSVLMGKLQLKATGHVGLTVHS